MLDVPEPVKVTAESLGVSQGQEYEGQIQYDLGNMMASDHGPIDQARFRADPDGACLEVATQMTQSLVARLFELPSEAALEGRIAHLPEPTTALPRAKPLPRPRAPTKWEQFAQRKGIVKKKRSKEVWDEESGEYRRRFGYKRAGDESEVPIIEASADDKIGEDPFSKLKQEMRERVKDQQKRQLQNIKASAKAVGSSAALPPTLKLAAALPAHGKGKPTKRKEMHDDIKQASRQAGVSTASMGKFDERLPGEKAGERVTSSKRQKYDPVSGKAGTELKKSAGLVDRIIREHADDILDSDKAVRRVEAERHSQLASARAQESDDEDKRPSRAGDKGKRSKGRGPVGGATGAAVVAEAAAGAGERAGMAAAVAAGAVAGVGAGEAAGAVVGAVAGEARGLIEGASGPMTPLSPALSALAQQEMEWANAGEKLAVLNFSEKVIEEKEKHLRECIANNYTRIKDVERELGGLQMQLKLSTGPKKSALMMIRKKIEMQNERVLAARDRQRAAKKVFEATEESLKAEEQVKERLCQELNLLVQQSAHAQLEKLEQLTERLERMNQSVGYSNDKEQQQEGENMPGNGSPAASPAHAAAARARHVPLAQPPRAGQATMPPAGAAGLRPPPSSGFRGFDT
ncbi:hypothetical protein WJX75_008410 [Coccomyxa subellipsoidea]|uniref:Ribosome biogenesis regulatory protein n=1 Tax=Coccomyxa subellipsoidea TaxID=248742 RepID=A0ABR2YYL5_9CHLO